MNSIIDALFSDQEPAGSDRVMPLNHHDIVVALSQTLSDKNIAVLHILYPRTDARTHRSLDALVDILRGQGLHQVASLIAKEAHYLLFKDPANAWRAFQEIRHDSLAIGAHLYYKGLEGDAAERALDADAHPQARARPYRVANGRFVA